MDARPQVYLRAASLRVTTFLAISLCIALAAARAVADPPATAPSEVARSVNFLVTAPTRELADDVLRQAEALRSATAKNWLGEELPAGVGVAFIHVSLSPVEDHALSWVADRPDQTHKIWLCTARDKAVGCTLAHEMVHAVLATQYPGRLPAWAHEGAAGLEDDAATKAVRTKMLAWWAKSGNWPSLNRVLDAKSISPYDQASYTLATSLAEFLFEQKDRQEYLAFALDGPRAGWEAAIESHYGYQGLTRLQLAWQTWAERRAAQ